MSENLSVTSKTVSTSFKNATGPIEFGFTNDYMFRAVMEENIPVLKGLVCSLLHLNPSEVTSVTVTNPHLLSDSYFDKEFVLDIKVILDNRILINLEMQLLNHGNWPERSLSYLCRRFDQLEKGEDYINCKPVIHISFLNFELFPKYPEFYATYKLLNIRNHNLYSDKFTLSVVDLSHIELATKEDKTYGIDKWARLFKAATWEEIKMLAENNPTFTEASQNLYILNADEMAKERARAREEYEAHENYLNKRIAEADTKYQEAIAELELLRARLAKYEPIS